MGVSAAPLFAALGAAVAGYTGAQIVATILINLALGSLHYVDDDGVLWVAVDD